MMEIIIAVLLFLLAVYSVVWPWLLRSRSEGKHSFSADRSEKNVELFAEHRRDIGDQKQQGVIDATTHQALLVELERTLLDDVRNMSKADALVDSGTADLGAVDAGNNCHIRASKVFGYLTAVGLAVIIFIATAGVYQRLGAVSDLQLQSQLESLQKGSTELDAEDILGRVYRRAQQRPDNSQYWQIVASAAMSQGQYQKAVKAYDALMNLDGSQADHKADLAQALFLRDSNQLSERVVSLAEAALLQQPVQHTALGLLGIDAFESKRYAEAIFYWRKTINTLGGFTAESQALAGGISMAAHRLREAKQAVPIEVAQLQVRPQLSSELVGLVAPDTTVFVYVKAWQGAPMPLAIQRFTLATLPEVILLDESMRMSPEWTMRAPEQLELVVRVSLTGNPSLQSGDWEGRLAPIVLQEVVQAGEPLTVEVSTQVP